MSGRLFTDKLVFRWLEGFGAWSLDSATHNILLATNAYPAHASGLSDSVATYTPGVSERRNGVSTFLNAGLKDVAKQTDTSVNVTATRKYDAYGMVIGATGTWKGPFGYSGSAGYQEDETGLQLLGHRYYDSSTGRFITRDPIKDGRNWYGYCGNNPVSYIDSEGLSQDSVNATIREALRRAVTKPKEALEMLEGLVETGGLTAKEAAAMSGH